jgi:hypothetical protein
MSVYKFLAADATESNSESGSSVSVKSEIGVLIRTISALVSFVIFVFSCIAATHSDSDSVYSACGHTLRVLLIVDIMFPSISVAAFFLIACCMCISGNTIADITDQSYGMAFKILVFLVLISMAAGLICLGYFSISESITAMSDSDCMSAMRNTTDGINSPSANTGTPLLAIMVMVMGIFHCMTAIYIVIYFFGSMAFAIVVALCLY